MTTWLQIIHWVSGLIVLAEALNKLERTSPCAKGLSPHDRLVDGLKAIAWAMLALGGGGAIATPLLISAGISSDMSILLRLDTPNLTETCVMAGFATLIVRTRIKEG
jgi:hypothetical protein